MTDGSFTARTVHIIGLGLMGGSLAMALRGKVESITAEDIVPDVLAQAQAAGVIDSLGTAREADIVVLATPADHIITLVPALDVRPGTLVIDLGSTKARICQQLDRLPEGVLAVGGHPMCGLAENGYHHAAGTLYRDARFVLCATQRATPHARALAEELVAACGAVPLWMDPAHHDYLTALTSHLPHLLNFVLMQLAVDAAADDPTLYALAAGGFDGATRLARTDEAMITGMFSTNAAQIRAVTAQLRAHLDQLDALLDDPARLREALATIVQARRAYTAAYGERLIT
jgi:prephenate dehydrogenase